MSRIYDRQLSCGCQYSSDGGGGCLPCYAETPLELHVCKTAHEIWHASEDYKKFLKECEEGNK